MDDPMTAASAVRPRIARWASFAAAAALLVIVSRQIVDLSSHPRPAPIAYWQDDAVVDALDRLEKEVATGPAPQRLQEIEGELLGLFARAPLERRTIYLLIGVERLRHETARADELEDLSSDLSLRDGPFQIAHLGRLLSQGKYAEVVRRIDGLVRAYPNAAPALLTELVTLTNSGDARPSIIEKLRENPPWRPTYMNYLGDLVSDRAVYFEVFRSLIEPQWRLTAAEYGGHLTHLIDWGRIGDARDAWVTYNRRRNIDVPYGIFDASFVRAPDDIPFGWQTWPVGSITRAFVAHPANPDQRALSFRFFGERTPVFGIQQVLALDPGPHVFSGKVKSEDLRVALGVVWRLYCRSTTNGNYSVSAVTPPVSGTHGWQEFRVEFAVPEKDCSSQLLRPETNGRAALDTEVAGQISYTDLAIDRR